MKTSALLIVFYIIAFSTFSYIFCLPRSLELSRKWLFTRSVDLSRSWPSKRSSPPGVPLCLLGRQSAADAHSTSSEEKDDEDMGHSCSKSIDLAERDDFSDSSLTGAHETRSDSTSAHSLRSKESPSKSSHSFSPRYWKSHEYTKSHKKSGYHPKKHKSHYFHQKFHPTTSYASVKKTGSKKDSTGSSAKHAASEVKYKGSPVKYTGSHREDYAGSMSKNDSPVNTTESEATDTQSLANNSGNALNDIDTSVNTANNTGSAVSNPEDEVQYTNENDLSGLYKGKATFFYQEGSPGACGKVHDDSAFIVAIQSKMYDDGKHCGKTVMITRKSTGKTIKAIAADECPGCPTDQSLDLSVGAFNALGNPAEGIFDINWAIVD